MSQTIKRIKIGQRWIGDDDPCFIIAEAGANHNRQWSLAKELIDRAAEAKADAIKFQIYSAQHLYSRKTPKHSYYKKHLWDLIKEIETPRRWIPRLKSYCDKMGIMFFATPFDKEAVDELCAVDVQLFKIASFELIDCDLLRYTARKKKPMIISTGLADMVEIEEAYLTCKKAGNDKLVLLQCASKYPAEPELINLRSMQTIRQAFDVHVGLSDHTRGIHIPVAAAAMGAKVIEKHFTLSRKMTGPDHSFSIEPDELKDMVKHIRDTEKAMGSGLKLGPQPEELENFKIARRSIHASKRIGQGERITEDKLVIKRPGMGIHPRFKGMIVGKRAERDIEEDQWITWEMIKDA